MMIEVSSLFLFLIAATVIAITPGPGMFYVAARTVAGGRGEGLASSIGTGLGGMVHVLAGAVGVSALVMASAEAFTILKLLGAAYLVWLGIKTIREARAPIAIDEVKSAGPRRAFREGILVEAFNPKTAAFFLAFLPQFVDPAADHVAAQFVVLGLISVTLNTLADVIVAFLASSVRGALARRPKVLRRIREASGVVICGLGASLTLVRRAA
jgi:threonine/homoserine/homoserine lactone efflux protein